MLATSLTTYDVDDDTFDDEGATEAAPRRGPIRKALKIVAARLPSPCGGPYGGESLFTL